MVGSAGVSLVLEQFLSGFEIGSFCEKRISVFVGLWSDGFLRLAHCKVMIAYDIGYLFLVLLLVCLFNGMDIAELNSGNENSLG